MMDFKTSSCTCYLNQANSLQRNHLQRSPGQGDQDARALEETKHEHSNDDQTIDQLIELEVGVVIDHPFELLVSVEGGGPGGVGPPRLLQAVAIVDPDLKPDRGGQPEDDEETDGEEEEQLDWVGGAVVQVLHQSSPALVVSKTEVSENVS